MDLTQQQIDTLVTLERVGSSLSLVGVGLIFVTYSAFKRMRTVPNLFLLFASVANAGASVACLIGFDGLRAGVDSALCQTQAFLLEMFMQADPWWSFAMAINVFLVFFGGANPATFRKHVWIYCVVCFGLPFIPAVACLLVKGEKGRVYGDATLWCWIGPEWTSLRIYTYYLPIWVCILFSTLIYFAVGYHVFHQRNQLRNLTFSTHGKGGKETSSTDVRDSAEKNLTGRSDVYGTAVTEVQITTCIPRPWTPPTAYTLADKRMKSSESLYNQGPYLGVDEERPVTAAMEPGSHARFETICSSTSALPRASSLRTSSSALSKFRAKLRNLDPVKLAYLRTSFVFAISILVTWTPSSINRVHNLIYANDVSYGLNVASAVVLPLQGVWNAVIYFSTSWGVCKEEMGKTWPGARARAWGAGKRTEKADAVDKILALEQNDIAILQADEGVRQGRTLMVFTFVTILFLPLSFLTSLFALDVASFLNTPRWAFLVIFLVSGSLFAIFGMYAIFSGRIDKWMSARSKKVRNQKGGGGEDIGDRTRRERADKEDGTRPPVQEVMRRGLGTLRRRRAEVLDEEAVLDVDVDGDGNGSGSGIEYKKSRVRVGR